MWKLKNAGINDLNISLHTTSEVRVRGKLYRRRDCVMLGPGKEVELGELSLEELKMYEPYKQLKCVLYKVDTKVEESMHVPESSIEQETPTEPVESVPESSIEQVSEPFTESSHEDFKRDSALEELSKHELQVMLKQKGISYRITESKESLIEKLRGEK